VQKIPQPTSAQIAEDWIKNRIAETLNILDDNYAKYRISDALMATYKLIWDDFCSWYLELIKPEFGKPIDFETHQNSLAIFEVLMQIVHPFMPFISEELYQNIKTRKPNDFIMVST